MFPFDDVIMQCNVKDMSKVDQYQGTTTRQILNMMYNAWGVLDDYNHIHNLKYSIIGPMQK